MLQSLWNPFRDWNLFGGGCLSVRLGLQSLWNPFRDWNHTIGDPIDRTVRFKASETLLGIETGFYLVYFQRCKIGFKASETLLGIETHHTPFIPVTLDKLQSLWNPFRDWNQ